MFMTVSGKVQLLSFLYDHIFRAVELIRFYWKYRDHPCSLEKHRE